jgi:hypothetical protein
MPRAPGEVKGGPFCRRHWFDVDGARAPHFECRFDRGSSVSGIIQNGSDENRLAFARSGNLAVICSSSARRSPCRFVRNSSTAVRPPAASRRAAQAAYSLHCPARVPCRCRWRGRGARRIFSPSRVIAPAASHHRLHRRVAVRHLGKFGPPSHRPRHRGELRQLRERKEGPIA